LHDRHIPGHYLTVLGLILVVSTMVVFLVVRGQAGKRSWGFFLLGVGFMLLETDQSPNWLCFGIDLGCRVSRDRVRPLDGPAANCVVSVEIIRRGSSGRSSYFYWG
jgi:hypothetical protein